VQRDPSCSLSNSNMAAGLHDSLEDSSTSADLAELARSVAKFCVECADWGGIEVW
jgi:hypothetical protein